MVFESYKFIFIKNKMFVKKEYLCDGFFKIQCNIHYNQI